MGTTPPETDLPELVSTLYARATAEMKRLIPLYLALAERTGNFSRVTEADVQDEDSRRLLLSGIASDLDPSRATAAQAVQEWERRQAVPFDTETSITTGVYLNLRRYAESLYDSLHVDTEGFTRFEAAVIVCKPYYLPLLQHLGGLFSKAQLKRQIGSVSDAMISAPAGQRLADYLAARVDPTRVEKREILGRLDSTLEGIVRDLVGRVLLESVVAHALEGEKLPFVREEDYESLAGVVYDFRADFVLPNAETPKVFIEVRKSSTRHASLYAKDKMFSAINWKGRHKDLLGVLVVDGPWTGSTLVVMAKVFDYVVPLGRAADLAKTIKTYLEGDRSKLKWLIEFRIAENR